LHFCACRRFPPLLPSYGLFTDFPSASLIIQFSVNDAPRDPACSGQFPKCRRGRCQSLIYVLRVSFCVRRSAARVVCTFSTLLLPRQGFQTTLSRRPSPSFRALLAISDRRNFPSNETLVPFNEATLTLLPARCPTSPFPSVESSSLLAARHLLQDIAQRDLVMPGHLVRFFTLGGVRGCISRRPMIPIIYSPPEKMIIFVSFSKRPGKNPLAPPFP